ncbi:MAG: DUF6448 family protein [Promicromonosporaceae bacterium]|nr:DUF6448 family protein [Promicromonosporaceae bacterium]
MSVVTSIAHLVNRLASRAVQPASAHCDTADGPVVTAGRAALASGNVNRALKWVHPEHEPQVRAAFAAAAGGDRLAALAFLETLVAVHRAGEGHDFTGIKPPGTPQPPAVTLGDEALAAGDVHLVLPLVEESARDGVAERFDRALALRDHDVDDLGAAREAVVAYVDYIHFTVHHRVRAAA